MLIQTLIAHFLDQILGSQAHKCHMLPLDQVKHRSNSGTIHALNSFDLHEWAYKTWGMTRCTKQVLSKECMHAKQFYLGLLEGEACHISEGASTHIWEI